MLYLLFFHFWHAAFGGFISFRWRIHLKCLQLQNQANMLVQRTLLFKVMVLCVSVCVCLRDPQTFMATSGIIVLVWLFLIEVWVGAHIIWGPFVSWWQSEMITLLYSCFFSIIIIIIPRFLAKLKALELELLDMPPPQSVSIRVGVLWPWWPAVPSLKKKTWVDLA